MIIILKGQERSDQCCYVQASVTTRDTGSMLWCHWRGGLKGCGLGIPREIWVQGSYKDKKEGETMYTNMNFLKKGQGKDTIKRNNALVIISLAVDIIADGIQYRTGQHWFEVVFILPKCGRTTSNLLISSCVDFLFILLLQKIAGFILL